MISMPPPGHRRANERPAVPTLERPCLVSTDPRPIPNWRFAVIATISLARLSLFCKFMIVDEMRQVVWRQAWHGCVLRSMLNAMQRGSNGTQSRSSQNSLQASGHRRGARGASRLRVAFWDMSPVGSMGSGNQRTARHALPADRNGNLERQSEEVRWLGLRNQDLYGFTGVMPRGIAA
jgi:hypothetical protein